MPIDRRAHWPTVFGISVLLVMLCAGLPSIGAAQNSALKAPRTPADIEKAFLVEIQKKIEALRAQTPPDYAAMANLYWSLFERYPNSMQGKMSAWEAYDLYRQGKDHTRVSAVLTKIMAVYSPNAEMANPQDSDKPIHIRASARVALSRLYAEQNNPLTALQIAQSVPSQFPDTTVGLFSHSGSYYGAVEVVCALDATRFSMQAGNYNPATFAVLELIREFQGKQIYTDHGPVDVEIEAIKIGNDAIGKLTDSALKKLDYFRELEQAATSPLAKTKTLFYRAEIQQDRYKAAQDYMRLEEAFVIYQEVLKRFPDVLESGSTGQMLLSVAAIRDIRKLFTKKINDPKRAIYELTQIAQEYKAKDTPNHDTIAAYAMYYAAMVNYRNLKNSAQALYNLDDLIENYPEVLVYPIPAGDTKPKLVDHIQTLLPQIRRAIR